MKITIEITPEELHDLLHRIGPELLTLLVVMSDGGSDFTSHAFQAAREQFGCWVRARVSQRGGMGILERVNRTLKHEFVFREEVTTKAELSACCVQFRDWYNTERLHSSLEYSRPWAKLLEAAKSRNAA